VVVATTEDVEIDEDGTRDRCPVNEKQRVSSPRA
jgi:hypothetical protein